MRSFMSIYVGNLPYDATEEELTQLFGEFGEITSVKIIFDKETKRSKGFGFVEMKGNPESEAAIEGLNGKDFKGRPLRVNMARERDSRPGGGSGGGRGGRPGGGGRPFGGGGGGRGGRSGGGRDFRGNSGGGGNREHRDFGDSSDDFAPTDFEE